MTADRRMMSSSVVRRQVPVTRPRATPHADTTSIPAIHVYNMHHNSLPILQSTDPLQCVALLSPFATFSARCNICISRLCHDVSVRLSVRLSVTFVHCGHRVRWIPDIFACLDRWMSVLLTDNASPGSSDRIMPGFLVSEGGMEKLVIVAISLILLIFYRWTVST